MPLTYGLQLQSGVQPTNPLPVDTWSGPYTGTDINDAISIANSTIPSGVRFISMEVRLIVDNVAYKYWYKEGTAEIGRAHV